jgi:hypothetical protein
MERRLTILSTLFVLAFVFSGFAQDSEEYEPIAISDEWKSLLTQDEIQVEYKVQECNNLNVRNQVLVLLRYTNTSQSVIKTFNWSVKEFRNDLCSNCNSLDSQEFMRSLTLSPGETLEGDGTSKMDKRVYLFCHFIELVPGMSNQTLTDFEFVNMEVINLGKQK